MLNSSLFQGAIVGFAVSTVCTFWVAIGAIVLHVVQPSLPFSTEGCAAVEINASAAFSGYNTIQNLLQEPSSLGITSLPPADNLMEWLVCVSVIPICPVCLSACLSVPARLPGVFVCLSVRVCPACLSACLSESARLPDPVCLSACLSASAWPCLSVCLPICLPVFVWLPVYLSISVCLTACLSVSAWPFLSSCLSVSAWLCLSVWQSVRVCLTACLLPVSVYLPAQSLRQRCLSSCPCLPAMSVCLPARVHWHTSVWFRKPYVLGENTAVRAHEFESLM